MFINIGMDWMREVRVFLGMDWMLDMGLLIVECMSCRWVWDGGVFDMGLWRKLYW